MDGQMNLEDEDMKNTPTQITIGSFTKQALFDEDKKTLYQSAGEDITNQDLFKLLVLKVLMKLQQDCQENRNIEHVDLKQASLAINENWNNLQTRKMLLDEMKEMSASFYIAIQQGIMNQNTKERMNKMSHEFVSSLKSSFGNASLDTIGLHDKSMHLMFEKMFLQAMVSHIIAKVIDNKQTPISFAEKIKKAEAILAKQANESIVTFNYITINTPENNEEVIKSVNLHLDSSSLNDLAKIVNTTAGVTISDVQEKTTTTSGLSPILQNALNSTQKFGVAKISDYRLVIAEKIKEQKVKTQTLDEALKYVTFSCNTEKSNVTESVFKKIMALADKTLIQH